MALWDVLSTASSEARLRLPTVSQTTAQIVLTLILLGGAIVFVLLDQQSLAVALVGAIAGQGASNGVRSVVNGAKA